MTTPQIPNVDAVWDSVKEGSYGDDLWVDFVAKTGPIPLNALVAVTLTLYDAETGFDATGAKIRDAQQLIASGVIQVDGSTPRCAYDPAAVNADGETVGRLTITTTAADTAVLHRSLDSELHGALFVIRHTGGEFVVQAALPVENCRFRSVP